MKECKAHIRTLETEIEELAKRPVLDHGSGLQALRNELSNEKNALQEARRGMSPNNYIVSTLKADDVDLSAG